MVLVSTNGLVINQHFCSGNLVEASLFFNSNTCDKEIPETTCCQEKAAAKNLATCGMNKTKKCCDDKVVLVQIDDESQLQVFDFTELMLVFVAIIPSHLFNLNLEIPTFHANFKNYKPPFPPEKDLAVLFQVFRC